MFDDYHELDDGIDLSFSSYVEDASDLEIEYEGLEAAVGALGGAVPEALVPPILGLAVLPLHEYQWVSVATICALAPRLEGSLGDDVRQMALAKAADSIATLPEELARWHWPELAPRLGDQQLDEVLSRYGGASDDTAQIRVLGSAAARLTGRGRVESTGAALELRGEPGSRDSAGRRRHVCLGAATGRRAEAGLELAAVARLSDANRRVRLLRDLAPHMEGPLREIAGAAALAVAEPDRRFSAGAHIFHPLRTPVDSLSARSYGRRARAAAKTSSTCFRRAASSRPCPTRLR